MIQSLKHDGRLHRQWLKNWQVPSGEVHPIHAAESMLVIINYETPVLEASGKTWVTHVPGVSFFIPDTWYNVVALIETKGIVYYCNAASPPFFQGNILTYVDYDLDVIIDTDGTYQLVDQVEFEQHRRTYRYSKHVEQQVQTGVASLIERIENRRAPFNDDLVYNYYSTWTERHGSKVDGCDE